MKQYILHTLSILFLLASCQQEEIPGGSGKVGYLSLDGFELSNGIETSPLTKAVDAQLNVAIQKEDDTSFSEIYEAGNVPNRIQLDAGTYTLKAYTTDYDKAEKAPSYYSETLINVKAGEITGVKMTVPMYNVGIKVIFPQEEMDKWFTSYSLTLSYDGKTETLTKDNTIIYFRLAANAPTNLTYTLEATNEDGEQSHDVDSISIPSGGMYVIQYQLDQ